MHEHDEAVAAMPPLKAKALDEAPAEAPVDKGKQKEVVVEVPPPQAAVPQATMSPDSPASPAPPVVVPSPAPPSMAPLASPQLSLTPPTPLPTAQHAVRAAPAPRDALVPPRPRGLVAALLAPPPASLAPLCVLHYYVLAAVLPPHMHATYLPPAPDRVLFLDCAIWAVGLCLALIAFDHWAVPRLEAAGWVSAVAAGGRVGAGAGAGAMAHAGHGQPAAVTGVRRPELDRPGQLELQVDGATLNGAPAAGGRVAVGNGQEGAYRHGPPA